MLPHQQQVLTAGNNFTFSSPTNKENSNLNHSDEMEYDTWAERIKGQYNYFGKTNDVKFGAWTRRNPRNSNPDENEFRWLAKAEDDESSTPSPELWKKAESPVIHSAESSPVRSYGYYKERDSRFSHISHTARAQSIAKYRQEMLDLVQGMPETTYELSLRDIVESPKITTPLQETAEDKLEEEKDDGEAQRKKKKEKKGKKEKDDGEAQRKKKKEKKGAKTMSRSESMETGGLLLKMFIPRIPSVLGGRKSTRSSGTCAKVSPKPTLGDAEKIGSDKSTDREWWNTDFEQMISSSGSSRSSNSSGRRRNRKLKGCYPFFQTR